MKFNKIALTAVCTLSGCFALTLGACDNSSGSGGGGGSSSSSEFSLSIETTMQTISKDEYYNKTLGGLLGQFAGFLSGYEFIEAGGIPTIGMPDDWFDFINGPYAGNFTHYLPPDYYHYSRLIYNEETGMNEVYSDDDYHIDILNQYTLKEEGTSAYALKETWKKYNVNDWGGGSDAMRLISSYDMIAPYSGSLEGGNRYGWCTEAYIENETLGMDAAGMPNVATQLVNTFSSNTGHYDSIIWAKFYSAIYSMCYFESDIKVILEECLPILPEGSTPYNAYMNAYAAYEKYPDDWRSAAAEVETTRIPLYGIDNIQTDCNINGAFAILSWLYGDNSYMETCKISSLIGYDADCTAAICCGAMGIIDGFKEENEEYEKINSLIYYDGEGIYHNDTGDYVARIKGDNYPETQKIDEIIDMYQENFEMILVENGGRIDGDNYIVPTSKPNEDRSFLFDNYNAEERTTDGFSYSGGTLSIKTESEDDRYYTNSGYASFKFTNSDEGEVYHRYTNLKKGHVYRLSVFVTNDGYSPIYLFARQGKNKSEQYITFNTSSIINKEFIFTADSTNMQIGFRFSENGTKGDSLYFDDFQLEEIERDNLYSSTSELKSYSGTYSKIIKSPVEVGKEVTLSLQVGNATGKPIIVSVYRNNNLYGSVVASSTGSTGNGYGYIEMPYVFEKETDTIKFDFDSNNVTVGSVNIYGQTQYMFR